MVQSLLKIKTAASLFQALTNFKLNSLCKWEFRAEINSICLSSHIILPGITTTFTTTTCFFFPAKGSTYFCATGSNIYIGNTAITPGHSQECFCLPEVQGHNG